ncbi:NAD-dependent epimerase/dehydratase family protein [Parasphingorhabdus halotolerans]|uniref:NAD-dependent epimerase/dehydratase family protein n=1 Tax=Parasphingorhabdus halotolerans TaxID=2725558 RepID=A0A6H2DKY8_9SPHN|nr:NAD-dependent epimerase/dehydratase family protein [Parasphingorhabdus halotolerans]QJB69014.1 NAD-dependent epimerase/dehydratase family protein [Parasphingorhabdus halotolerans]
MDDKILIVGATGLIGGHVVRQLITGGRDKNLHLLMRRDFSGETGEAKQHVADNANWPEIITSVKPDVTISCLGSTMKKAGSKEAFAAIDRDLVTAVAEAAKAAGTRHFLSVSSTMANSSASSFYLKVKGQAEDALRAQNFDRLDITRPGLLRGERTNDPRLGESLAIIASPLMDMLLQGSLRRYRSIDAKDVARAMVALLGHGDPGQYIHENDGLWELANETREKIDPPHRIIDLTAALSHF